MPSQPWMLTWTLLAAMSVTMLGPPAVPAGAQESADQRPAKVNTAPAKDKKIIKKGSGQFEEYYELLPPEDGEDDATPAAAGTQRAPAGTPKSTFGTPALVPAAKPMPARQPPPPAPSQAEDATTPMDEPMRAPGPAITGKKPLPAAGGASPAATQSQQAQPGNPAKPNAGNISAPKAVSQDVPAAPSATDFFLAALDQGGAWTRHAKHGDVFVPEGGSDWRPYTAGRWIYDSALGWTWISDETHGWATYHYGRWAYEKDTGWFWVPGTEWAPSWVVWRQGSDAIGWAPLPPAAQFTSKGVSLDAKVIESDSFERAWVFVAPRYFGQQVMRRFIRPLRWNADLVGRTSPILGYQRKDGLVANRGIAVEEVARLAGNPPQRMTVSISPDVRFKQPSFRGAEEVKIYRPDERQIAELARKADKIKQGGAASGIAKRPAPNPAANTATNVSAPKRFSAQPKAERSETNGSVTETWVQPGVAPVSPKGAPDTAARNSNAETPAKAEQPLFAPAPAVQRTETGGAVTETWGGSTPNSPAGPGGRAQSNSVPTPDGPGDTPATGARATSGTQTGSTSKPRWDGSGASGGPAPIPGSAP